MLLTCQAFAACKYRARHKRASQEHLHVALLYAWRWWEGASQWCRPLNLEELLRWPRAPHIYVFYEVVRGRG